MGKFFCKWLMCICFILSANSVFASSLSSVEIVSDNGVGKIYLGIDKSVINKKKISLNEIQIQLKNTGIIENLKTIYKNAPKDIEISVIQNGKHAFINIFGENIADFELLYAKDGSFIPLKNNKKDIAAVLLILAGVLGTALLSKKINNLNKNSKGSDLHTETVIRQKNQIIEINTLRNKSNQTLHNSIHGNVHRFANTAYAGTVTVPEDLQKSDFEFIEYKNNLKKAVKS
ncbi:MAG: hypothetical protein K6C94_03040 [Candidatus Gastranaerophilales bacterium]|nr:hypothetical protein [Candidatus Gastranaerophilales bacterium]